jgi:sugar phosphate isomerase/epimerase
VSIACSTSAWKVGLDEALGHVSRLGFQKVDLICIPSWGHVSAEKLEADFEHECRAIRHMLAGHGLTAVAANLAVGNLYERGDGAANAARLRHVDAVARLMKRLNIGVASFFPGGKWPAQEMRWTDVLSATVDTVHEILAVGRTYQVTFAVELHANTPFETVEQGSALLEAVPELGVAYDPSHYAMQQIPLRSTARFLDRARHVHLRDAAPGKMCVRFGDGTVDFEWLYEALHARHYSGHCSIEYLPGFGGDARTEITALKHWWAKRFG